MTLEIHKYDVPVRVGNSDWVTVQVASVDKATAVANAKLRVEIGIPVEVCTCHCAACVAIRDTKAIIKDAVARCGIERPTPVSTSVGQMPPAPVSYKVSKDYISFHDAVSPALLDYLVAYHLGYRVTEVRESGTIYMQHHTDKDFIYVNSSRMTDYNFEPSSDLNLAYALREAAKAEKRFFDHGDLTKDYHSLNKVLLSGLIKPGSIIGIHLGIPNGLVKQVDLDATNLRRSLQSVAINQTAG